MLLVELLLSLLLVAVHVAFPALVTVEQVENNSKELFSNAADPVLRQFEHIFLTPSQKSALLPPHRLYANAISSMCFHSAVLQRSQTAVLVYKQALSYFPILGHSCSIQHSAGCHVRAGNAGFIKRGRVGRGGSPALRDDDKSRVWYFTGL